MLFRVQTSLAKLLQYARIIPHAATLAFPHRDKDVVFYPKPSLVATGSTAALRVTAATLTVQCTGVPVKSRSLKGCHQKTIRHIYNKCM